MWQAPRFWQNKNARLGKILNPLGKIYAFISAQRLKKHHPYQAKMPVLCVGNLSVGGVGKTPVCLALGRFLRDKGKTFYYLNHGYKARQQSVLVDTAIHTPLEVGDEALLLAQSAPTIVDSARARGAQLAEKLGADFLVMDDGFQNPSLVKTFSFIVVDGHLGFGNERVLPAGPLREPVLQGLKRADAIVLVGEDIWGVEKYLQDHQVDLPLLKGTFVPDSDTIEKLKNIPNVGAFAGIGHPDKFFKMLEKFGLSLKVKRAFPDHYFYTRFDLMGLKKEFPNVIWATTTKDWVKVSEEMGENIIPVAGQFQFEDVQKLQEVLGDIL